MFQNSITEGENLQGQKLSIVEETMSDSYRQLNTITIALSGYMYIHVSLHPYSGANQAVVQRWKDHLIVLEHNITSNVAFLTSNIFTVRMKKAWVLSYPLSAQFNGRMPRMIWVFAGRTVTLLVLSCRGSICLHMFIDIHNALPQWSKVRTLRASAKFMHFLIPNVYKFLISLTASSNISVHFQYI